jgi:hypothetical protein
MKMLTGGQRSHQLRRSAIPSFLVPAGADEAVLEKLQGKVLKEVRLPITGQAD